MLHGKKVNNHFWFKLFIRTIGLTAVVIYLYAAVWFMLALGAVQ